MTVGWAVWALRTVIAWVGGSALAFIIAFQVADYVVRANTSSASETMRALQSSIENLNASVRENTSANIRLQEQMAELMRQSERQEGQLAAVREDLTKVQDAVQDSGIAIKIGSGVDLKTLGFSEFKTFYGLSPDEKVFIELPKGD